MHVPKSLYGLILIIILSLLSGLLVLDSSHLQAQVGIPPGDIILSEDFSGSWNTSWKPRPDDGTSLQVVNDQLQVTVTSEASYLRQFQVMDASESYLTFRFNPNNVTIPEQTSTGDDIAWIPSKSVLIAQIVGSTPNVGEERTLAAVHLYKPADAGYQIYLWWHRESDGRQAFNFDANNNLITAELQNGWQTVTIGYKTDSWVSLWVNGELKSSVTDIKHIAFNGASINLGKAFRNTAFETSPSGTILYDDVELLIPTDRFIPKPTVETTFSDNFDSGQWNEAWRERADPGNVSVVSGNNGQVLQTMVNAEANYLIQPRFIAAEEGYLSFWFNPNGVIIPEQDSSGNELAWIPSKSIVIAEINGPTTSTGTDERATVALHLYKPANSGYKVYLRWSQEGDGRAAYDFTQQNEFDLIDIADGWQKLTIGYRIDDWVALWINDTFATSADAAHFAVHGANIAVGKIWVNEANQTNPSGTIWHDNIAFEIPRAADTPTPEATNTPTVTNTPQPTNTPTFTPSPTPSPTPLTVSVTETILEETFETGSWDDDWRVIPNDTNLSVIANSRGQVLQTQVTADRVFLQRANFARAEEGYFSFWFNPNNVVIPEEDITYPLNKSIALVEILGPRPDGETRVLVGLDLFKPADQGYQIYLRWNRDDGAEGQIKLDQDDAGNINTVEIANDWQKITLGYRVDEWVAVWLNGEQQPRRSPQATHISEYGSIVRLGKLWVNDQIVPSGTVLFDDLTFAIPKLDSLWVNANNNSGVYDGLTPQTGFPTISQAANLAVAGTTINILPGLYRESVTPIQNGTAENRIVFQKVELLTDTESLQLSQTGEAIIRGSEPVTWTQLITNDLGFQVTNPQQIYYTDLSAWELEQPPRFVVQFDDQGNFNRRLPLAREPDWQVTTDWKHHEFWWMADGGSTIASCDPRTDSDPVACDAETRSTTQLTDRSQFEEKVAVEPGDLTTVGDLTGGKIFALDANTGHYMYYRTITAHDTANGTITVDEEANVPGRTGGRARGLGWGSKYFVEGKPQLLDNPGEWWYDSATKRLYLWPLDNADPNTQNIEISRRSSGFVLTDKSYITIDGLTIEFFDYNGINQENSESAHSYDNIVRNVTVRYANRGVWINQNTDSPANVTRGFILEGSTIAHTDSSGLFLNFSWGNGVNNPADFTHAGVTSTTIRNNTFYDLAFRNETQSNTPLGLEIIYADHLRLENNHIYDVAHNGVIFARSIIQPQAVDKKSNFDDEEIKIGNVLVKGNLFENACQNGPDCGGLKFWGAGRDENSHVFRDVLIMDNIFRNNMGWGFVSEQRGWQRRGIMWSEGTVLGKGGFGLYADLAAGLHVYRNIAYNNPYMGYSFNGLWQDGLMIYYNNIAANSLYGFRLDATAFDLRGSVNSQFVNNIVVNNERYGLFFLKTQDDIIGDLVIDYNLYFSNHWNKVNFSEGFAGDLGFFFRDEPLENQYDTFGSTQEARDQQAPWETQGIDGNPNFVNYDITDHDPLDGSEPNFSLTANSTNAIDQGKTQLPNSLQQLLTEFGVAEADPCYGRAFDIGPDEFETDRGQCGGSVYLPLILKF